MNLKFDPKAYVEKTYDYKGEPLTCYVWENVPYVSNPNAPHLQCMNIYVPEGHLDDHTTPIYLMELTGGMGEAKPMAVETDDRKWLLQGLKAGYIVVSPGARGRDTVVDGVYVGRGDLPMSIVDLKAAVRYLHHNAGVIPGNTERIIEEGCSSGGGMAALLGCTGNSVHYQKYLDEIGAADARDDVYCAVVNAPITDFEHIDIAYEWLFSYENVKGLYEGSATQKEMSSKMAKAFEEYVDTLNLKDPKTGAPIGFRDGDTYTPYFIEQMNASATKYLSELSEEDRAAWLADPQNKNVLTWDGTKAQITSISNYIMWNGGRWMRYICCYDGLDTNPSRENQAFGTQDGQNAHFSRSVGEIISSVSGYEAIGQAWLESAATNQRGVYLVNPFNFIGTQEQATLAPVWFMRCGAHHETTGNLFMNLTLLLQNRTDAVVDARYTWNQRHTMISALEPKETFEFLDKYVRT